MSLKCCKKKKVNLEFHIKQKYLPRKNTKIFLDVLAGNLDFQEEMKSKRFGKYVEKYKV